MLVHVEEHHPEETIGRPEVRSDHVTSSVFLFDAVKLLAELRQRQKREIRCGRCRTSNMERLRYFASAP